MEMEDMLFFMLFGHAFVNYTMHLIFFYLYFGHSQICSVLISKRPDERY